MILRLVDRQISSQGEAFSPALWTQLQTLVKPIGRQDWLVDVVLLADEAMVKLNHEFRKKDEVTDVLSFSYLLDEGEGSAACEAGQDYAPHALWQTDDMSVEGEGAMVGELVLAPAFIDARCQAQKWPWAAEVPMLIVHGCLHLLGWDHQEPVALAAMQNWEVEILATVGLSHPLRPRS